MITRVTLSNDKHEVKCGNTKDGYICELWQNGIKLIRVPMGEFKDLSDLMATSVKAVYGG